MSKNVFNKKLPKYCEYCINGICSEFSDEVFCVKKGVTDKKDYCRHYKYDPLKRQPSKAKISTDYTKEDFLL